jgi:hypothetical protein
MIDRNDLIQGSLDLVSYFLKKREPQVIEEMPSVRELEEKLNEIHGSRVSTETAPETENAGEESEEPREGLPGGSKSISQGTACIPCSQDHLSTCSGLLAEALRFARKDGVESAEVISRIGLCRDELNAMERVDLRPEVTWQLPDWERKLASDVLNSSRGLRHDMAEILSVDDLEKVAGSAQSVRGEIGKQWLKGRISNMSPGEKAKVREKAQEILDEQLISEET